MEAPGAFFPKSFFFAPATHPGPLLKVIFSLLFVCLAESARGARAKPFRAAARRNKRGLSMKRLISLASLGAGLYYLWTGDAVQENFVAMALIGFGVLLEMTVSMD